MFRRMLLAAALSVAVLPIAHAAGDAVACPVDDAAVAAIARDLSAGLFTRPEATVPAAKRTARGLYLTAQDAYDMVSEAPDKVLFVDEVGKRLAGKALARDDTVIVLCQGGLRAARAANALTQAGYTRVYTTIDGFEGDPVADGPHKGERLVNGWRNAGLPWTAKLDRAKMHGMD